MVVVLHQNRTIRRGITDLFPFEFAGYDLAVDHGILRFYELNPGAPDETPQPDSHAFEMRTDNADHADFSQPGDDKNQGLGHWKFGPTSGWEPTPARPDGTYIVQTYVLQTSSNALLGPYTEARYTIGQPETGATS